MKQPMILNSDIVKELGLKAGADVIGIASSKDFGSAPEGFKPTDVLPECVSVIVLGATFPPEVLEGIDEYSASRNSMVTLMTDMAKKVAKEIKTCGYTTKAVSSVGGKWIENNGKKEQYGYMSLKHAAEIAGLGIIGKNYLLTSPEYGNLIWLSAVLTDAELVPDERIQSDMCGGCSKCIEACPAKALDDPDSFGRRGCAKFFTIEGGKFRIKCFRCRTVCPHRFGKRTE